MKSISRALKLAPALLLMAGMAHASEYTDTINLVRNAGESASFFRKSYGYAVFPTVGEGGFLVGGALGKGHVYAHGRYVGDTTMGQVSVGFQAGGKAYSQMIFFEDKRALDEFESGSFEFAAGASAVAITAAASASAGTNGTAAEASGGKKNARASGHYEERRSSVTTTQEGHNGEAAIAAPR